MNETTRQAVAVALGVGVVAWQASVEPGRAFAAVLLLSALGYAFAPVVRDGVV
ncbi:hypothetical protein [Halorussus aquaticus]|uniref:Uncharacterized protein n=1 Tax=Halorussus aquaticus TaxID=2953748 RepID=A0ABD5Q292_9EURY|nr:hypothetical protein [Halorussus aquaticus]